MRVKKYIIAALVTTLALSGCKDNKTEESIVKELVYKPTYGGEITIGVENIGKINPILNNSKEMEEIFTLIHEPLFKYDDNFKLINNIGENSKLVVNGYGFEFNIAKNMKFSDGSEITNEDIKYSIDTMKEDKNSPYYNEYKNIAYYKAMSNGNFRVVFNKRIMDNNYFLDFPVLNKDNLNATSGQYYLAEESTLKKLVLVPNKHFEEGKPYIGKVNVLEVENKEVSFKNKAIDMFEGKITSYNKYKQSEKVAIRDLETEYIEMIAVNKQKENITDKEVLNALESVIDRKYIKDHIYNTHAKEVTSFDLNYENEDAKEVVTTDAAEKAIKKLEFDKIGDVYEKKINNKIYRLEYNMLINIENETRAYIAKYLKETFEKMGVKLNIVSVPFADYKTKLENGDYDFAIVGMNMTENKDLTTILHSYGKNNYSNFSAKELDEKLNEAYLSTNDEQINNIYSDIYTRVLDEKPYMPLVNTKKIVVADNKIKGDLKNGYSSFYKLYVNEEQLK